jgi:hypothetical protein
VMDNLVDSTHITVQVQWVPKVLNSLPDWMVETLMGLGMTKFNDLKCGSYPYVLIDFMTANPNKALR